MTDHDYYPQGNSLDDSVQTAYVSRAFMVWIFRVLAYMHLHAREIRVCVYQTIKWHLLKLLLLIFFLNITIKNFYLCLFNSHIFSDFLDCLWYNKTLIYWLRDREIVGVSGDNKLAIVLIASKQVYTILTCHRCSDNS